MDFRLTRRALLASALPLPALAQTATLAPDGPALRWDGKPGQITLPPWSPRTMALAPIGGAAVTAVALTNQSADSTIEILLVAGHDGNAPRVLALEVLQWQAPNGKLGSRPIIDSDRGLLIFDRSGALKRNATQWQRESWRDFLSWDGTMLVDKPVRTPPAGSQQAILARVRARTLAWLATPRQSVSIQDLVTLRLDAQSFDLR